MILLSLVLIYSVAICCISFLAKKTMLEETGRPTDASVRLNSALYKQSPDDENFEDKPFKPDLEGLEVLESKADIHSYPFFDVVATDVSISTSAPPTEETTVSPTVAEETTTSLTATEKPAKATEKTTEKTTGKTTEATTSEPENVTEPTTATPETTEPEITDPIPEIEENDDPDIELDESVQDEAPDVFDNDYISGIISNIPNYQESFYYPGDNLYNGKSYHDDIVTYYDKSSGRYITDNAFDIICNITYNEIGDDKHIEAIKAQAVAVYSYIKHYEQRGEYASLSSKKNPPQIIIDAVNAVDGLAMYYGDEYVMAAFSAASAGVTCSAETVWGGGRPYLQSVVSEFDYLDEKNYGKISTYTVDEVRKKIESKTDIRLSDNYADWIRILSYNEGNYVDKIAIDGHTTARVSGKERELTAYIFRSSILNIRSTCFTVSYSDGVFTFVTYGYGHGVGMPQKGANLYATYAGYTFDMILHHYYTDIDIR